MKPTTAALSCVARAVPAVLAGALMLVALVLPAAHAQVTTEFEMIPPEPRAGEPVSVRFDCPGIGGLDAIDERRTRVRMVGGVIRMDVFSKFDDSFGFCIETIRLGWLPEGSYALELWFDGVLRGQRTFSIRGPDPIPEGQRGPATNFAGFYSSPFRPGRNASVIQSGISSALVVVLTGYDLDRRSTNWLLICERWIERRRCEGTVYESTGDPYTFRPDLATAQLTAVGRGLFVGGGSPSEFVAVFASIRGVEFADTFRFLRF
jgi:hypothetical protein